jgi:cellulose synthase/poly-beta-1,6-N-acetylglucosamine synthase-like glycosyltransferase
MSQNQVANSADNQTFLPKVSVIVPIYNGETDLPGLIECLKAQTYPMDRVEYLLVDNASRDRTPTLLSTAAREAASNGINLSHLTEDKIQSSYAARNTGIRASKGEILAFTDADCRPQPQWLSHLVQPFANPAVGLVVGEITALPGTTWLEKHAERHNVLTQKDTLAHPFCPYGQTANLAIRRQVFKEIGLFRPYMTTGGDADMCWRIQLQGKAQGHFPYQLYFAETALVQHRHRATFEELQKQWYRYGRSNKYLHELHGVALQPKLTPQKSLYLMSRWLFKQLPLTAVEVLAGKAPAVDLLNTPINLFGAWARDRGQRETQLPQAAKTIDWLQK